VADDDLGDDASEPSGSPQVGPDRQVEAGDHLSPADAVEMRPTVAANRASNPPGSLRGIFSPATSRNRSTTGPNTPESSFFTPQAE
jgi:hypothetical protein